MAHLLSRADDPPTPQELKAAGLDLQRPVDVWEVLPVGDVRAYSQDEPAADNWKSKGRMQFCGKEPL